MDFSKISSTDWLKIIGALGTLIFGLINWDLFPVASYVKMNAFDFPIRGTIPWLLIIVLGISTLMRTQGRNIGKLKEPIIQIAFSGVATLLLLLLVLMILTGSEDNWDIRAKVGSALWLTLLSSIVALSGSLKAFLQQGGVLKDLSSPAKIKEMIRNN